MKIADAVFIAGVVSDSVCAAGVLPLLVSLWLDTDVLAAPGEFAAGVFC